MPDQFLTLKDIAAREYSDQLVGLIEDVVNVAPEIDRVQGRVIPGIHYQARVRTALHQTLAFRKANAGTALGASSYDQKRFNCYAFDAQMRLDEAVAVAADSNGDSMGSLLAEEASGAMRSKAIALGKQFYQGSLFDVNGPPGLTDFMVTQQTQIDSRTGAVIDQVIDAGATTASHCQTVWFVHMSPQGIHWLYGAGRGLVHRPWREQQVSDANGAKFFAWVSNVFGFVGTSCANYHAVGAIKNVLDNTTTFTNAGKALTDGFIAQLWAKFPIGLKPNMAFASQLVISTLQQARTVTLFANADRSGETNSGGASNMAPWPTNLPTAGGIPIIPTDSIVPGNQVTVF